MINTNILIVNHNVDEAKSIRNRLAAPSTTTICAHTIEEALDAFGKMEFCLVILDAAMSSSDDHNILKAMRRARTMPILVLSSHSDHTERIHAFQAGAHAYMGKPYTEEELFFGRHILGGDSPFLVDFLKRKVRTLTSVIEGKRKGNADAALEMRLLNALEGRLRERGC